MIEQVRFGNMDAIRKAADNSIHQINLFATIAMDNEPQHFLQMFQGTLAVTTDDYLQRARKYFSDDPDGEECYVMMF